MVLIEDHSAEDRAALEALDRAATPPPVVTDKAGASASTPTSVAVSFVPFAPVVELTAREYGADKTSHLKDWSVSFMFIGRGGAIEEHDLPQPVKVRALDESDAWAQVVWYYELDASRYKPMIRQL